MTASPQRFSFGYQLITWDFGPLAKLEAGLARAAEEGFAWFEILLGDTLGNDFARRALTLGPVPEPAFTSDTELFRRLALVAGAENRHGIRPSSVYADGEWLNDQLWPAELAKAQVLTRFLAGLRRARPRVRRRAWRRPSPRRARRTGSSPTASRPSAQARRRSASAPSTTRTSTRSSRRASSSTG